MSEDCDDARVLSLLDDEYARTILTATSHEPLSANELAETYEMSPPTVYRRVEALKECALLTEETRYAESGHHFAVYRANVGQLRVTFDDGRMTLDVDRESDGESPADRFTRLYEELR
ncbi:MULTISPECIES: winged helix-turn-helix domain-containing protein [Haloferax]|uniref:winged helix-turn-helix domain-containing protein n=1 Tax=Haloferax TaxID=2251 RepID=UPI00177F576F|nr:MULTISPECIES: winged helix-turn-helix domain-containing protein [Haloferax]